MPFNSELQTERDCTREDVRAQARWEFERARGDTQLAADWCCRWGLSLLAAADAPDVSDELEEAEAEAKRNENKCIALIGAIERAIEILDRAPREREVIDAAITLLEGEL